MIIDNLQNAVIGFVQKIVLSINSSEYSNPRENSFTFKIVFRIFKCLVISELL